MLDVAAFYADHPQLCNSPEVLHQDIEETLQEITPKLYSAFLAQYSGKLVICMCSTNTPHLRFNVHKTVVGVRIIATL